MGNHTVIIGGGLAGLAAATALADRGGRVTLLESRPRLGGRASSFVDRTTGERIDNCQHVSMGCCTNFDHFCGTLGLDGMLRRERELYFIGPDGLVNRFSSRRLPAPFHLWPAFRGLSYLGRTDLRAIAGGLRALARDVPARSSGPEQTFDHWLREHNQTLAAMELFWHVVLVSALSESLDRVGVAEARKVFVDGFLANRHGWQVRIPTVPLDDLYGERLMRWLTERGAAVRLKSGAERVVLEGNKAAAVELRDGSRLEGDHFVVAVPQHRVLSLLPERLQADPSLRRVAELESAPISSVHLWFDHPITDLPHAVLVGRLSQWMFNRGTAGVRSQESGVKGQESAVRSQRSEVRDQKSAGHRPQINPQSAICNPQSARTTHHSGPTRAGSNSPLTSYYQVVISASRNLAGRSQPEVVDEVVRELAEIWPEAKQAKLIHSRMVTEHRAVFSVKPGADDLRPAQQSPVSNLQLAGDWTRTGWPATMEGAVRSGYLAAENVLAQSGRSEKLVQPDLPVGWLAKLLLRL